MRKINTRIKAIIIFTILIFSIAIPLIATPAANAHTPPWKIVVWPYIDVAPDNIGVGQTINIYTWVNWVLPGASTELFGVGNNIRFHDYEIVITKPDNTIQKISIPLIFDSTSSAYTPFTPNQVGTYSFVFNFPEQTYTWNQVNTPGLSSANAAYENDTFLAASSKTVYLNVQQEQLPTPITSYPLPTEYWTRPIEQQNTDWHVIASNWLGQGSPKYPQNPARFQPDGLAPNSAHVMWSRPLGDGGLVGGDFMAKEAEAFYHGSSYQYRFYNPIIMNGRLFYALPQGNALRGDGYLAVDLRTGEELWYNENVSISSSTDIRFGYYYAYEIANQHGVIPNGWLFTNNFGMEVDPINGKISSLKITNVPSGYEVYGPSGEHLRYVLNNANHWLAQWNSSKAFDVQYTGTIDAGQPRCYDWNVTIPALTSGTSAQGAIYGDVLLGLSTLAGIAGQGTPDPYTAWAISLKPGSEGQLLWMKAYSAPADNVTRRTLAVDPVNRVFILRDKETFQSVAFSLDDGTQKWVATAPEDTSDFEYYDATFLATMSVTAYGRLYHSGYAGVLRCYDTKDGSLLWTYGDGDTGNSTYAGLASPYGHYPIYVMAIADGKVFIGAGEHSADAPLYKGFLVRCVNATTGKEIWTLPGYLGYPGDGRAAVAVAEGFFTFYNGYDSQVYCVGKGPSALTVNAPNVGVELGRSIVIRGTVIDIAAGTKQKEQAARFPNGVPAMSDASMSSWMQYVYMQKPKPTDAIGVPVRIDVVDSNGNYRNIGTATSDSSGMFTFTWVPDIEGTFYVIASFEGSESYWPSRAETSFSVDPAATTPAPTQAPIQSVADMYFVPAVAGIIVAIIVGFALMALLLLRKRP